MQAMRIRTADGYEVLPVTRLRLALYDPINPNAKLIWHDDPLPLTARTVRHMRRVCREFRRLADKDPDVTLCLGVFPFHGT